VGDGPLHTFTRGDVPSLTGGGGGWLGSHRESPLGDRWAHVQAVTARAEELRPAAASDDERHLLLVAVAWEVVRPRVRPRATEHRRVSDRRRSLPDGTGLPGAAAHPSWLPTRAASC